MPTKPQVTRKRPRQFKIWFEQVNQEAYTVSATSRDKAIAKAKRDWRRNHQWPMIGDVVEIVGEGR